MDKHIIICHEPWLKSVNIQVKQAKCLSQRSYHCPHDFVIFYHKYLGFDVFIQSKDSSLRTPHAYTTIPVLRGGAVVHKGRSANLWTYEELQQFVHGAHPTNVTNKYLLKSYIPERTLQKAENHDHMLVADIPITILVTKLSKQHLWQVAQSHHLMNIS